MDLSRKAKFSHLRDLIELSLVDNQNRPIEQIYIEKVAESIGVDDDELAALYKDIQEGGVEKRALPDLESQIIPLFHRLVIVMTIDKEVHPEEIRFCKELGLKMGLNLFAVDELMEIAQNEDTSQLTPARINEVFRKYYN